MKILSNCRKLLITLVLLSQGCFSHQARADYTVNYDLLNTYQHVHPRLFIDSTTIPALQTTITNATPTDGTRWTVIWNQTKTTADSVCGVIPFQQGYVDSTGTAQLWQRTMADDTALLTSMYVMTKQTPPATDAYWIEAEETALTSPMAVQSDSTASGAQYLVTTAAGTPSATYNFSVQGTRNYTVYARILAPSSGANSFLLNVDGSTNLAPSTTTYGSWQWVSVGTYNLTQGNHTLNIAFQNPGLEIDKFYIASSGAPVPTGMGTEQHWLNASIFTLNNTNYSLLSDNGLTVGTSYLEQTGSHQNWTTPAAGSTPDAQQSFSVNGGANYDVWVRFNCFTSGHNFFYYAFDSGNYSTASLSNSDPVSYNPLQPLTPPAYKEWVWHKVATNISLSAGSHLLRVTNGGSEVSMDRFAVLPTGSASPADPNKYLVGARNYAMASCSYTTWGQYSNGTNIGVNLPASHQLFSLALIYDWCYSDLSSTDLATILNKINWGGTNMNNGFVSGGPNWWKTKVLMNQCWVDCAGLGIAGAAIYRDTGADDVTSWLNNTASRYNTTVNDLGTDGADQEGVSYYDYGLEWFLKYAEVAKKLLGMDFYPQDQWLSSTANYRLYFDLPLNSQSNFQNQTNFADDVGYDWNGPDYTLRKLASKYNIPTAQWQAAQYDLKAINAANASDTPPGGAPWLNLLWYDPTVTETSPTAAGLAPFCHFPDLDFTISRSGWDGNESIVAYQCGPFMGHSVETENAFLSSTDWGSDHVHPAVNNFSIFGYGSWLLLNCGYDNSSGSTLAKMTNQGNTLLINGAGQLGESTGGTFQFAPAAGGGSPTINTTVSQSTTAYDYIVGDAATSSASIYPSADGLTKFRRHLLYLKPDVLVVVDDVVLNSSLPLELRFYPQNVAPVSVGANTYETTASNGTKLDINLLTSSTSVYNAPTSKVTWTSPGGTHYCYRVTPTLGSASSWSNAVSLAWSPTGSTPKTVSMLADSDGTAWKFKVGTQTMVLNRSTDAFDLVSAFEAESVTPVSPMVVYTGDSTASGGSYIATPTSTTQNSPDTLTTPSASYSFNVPTTGSYNVWLRVKGFSTSIKSFYSAINPTGSTVYNSQNVPVATYGTWTWAKLPVPSSFSAGTNVVALKYEDGGVQFDQLIVTSDLSYTPDSIY